MMLNTCYLVATALDQSVKMMIYTHAGLTAILRSDFLKTMGDNLPFHVKQGLLYENFGGTGPFNSQIDKYLHDIELDHSKMQQQNLTTAVQNSLQGKQNDRSSGNPSAPPAPVNSNSGGFY